LATSLRKFVVEDEYMLMWEGRHEPLICLSSAYRCGTDAAPFHALYQLEEVEGVQNERQQLQNRSMWHTA